jgi:hypothetical protein
MKINVLVSVTILIQWFWSFGLSVQSHTAYKTHETFMLNMANSLVQLVVSGPSCKSILDAKNTIVATKTLLRLNFIYFSNGYHGFCNCH